MLENIKAWFNKRYNKKEDTTPLYTRLEEIEIKLQINKDGIYNSFLDREFDKADKLEKEIDSLLKEKSDILYRLSQIENKD